MRGWFFVILVTLCSAQVCQAMTYTVPSPVAPTIESGLAVATNGDTILVLPGTYYEHDLALKSGVTILGSGSDVTTIDASQLGRGFIGTSLPNQTSILNLSITGAHPAGDVYGGAILIQATSVVISNVVLYGNYAYAGGAGIMLMNGSSATIVDCSILDNTAVGSGGGICSSRSSFLSVESCIIRGNTTGFYGGGIYCFGTPAVIVNNTIESNRAAQGGGIFASNNTVQQIEGNVIARNHATAGGGAIANWNWSQQTLVGNTIVYNTSDITPVVLLTANGASSQVDKCVIAFNGNGIMTAFSCGNGSSVTVQCSDIYSTPVSDDPCITLNANVIHADPLMCNPQQGDYSLWDTSPALTQACGHMGAYPSPGCSTPVLIQPTTWGRLKSLYH